MELKGLGNTDEAWEHFSQLITSCPTYLPSYGPTGDLLTALGRIDDARAVYSKGIAIAEQQGNHHIQDLLKDALDSLTP
jgi:predicted RNA polymerase sigma factor